MRYWLALHFCLVAPLASAWEFTPLPICTLFHQGTEMAVTVTYDPAIKEYAIHLERDGGWPDASVFSMRFEGPQAQTISTTRHVIGEQGANVLTVRDRGFGNVLDGLAFNSRAVAIVGDLEVTVPLDGAAPEVDAFRACPINQFVRVPKGTQTDIL